MQNKKISLNKRLKIPLIAFILILLFSFIYTLFYPLPTEIGNNTLGLGAELLDIGDRDFYIGEADKNYGYGEIKGGFFYPLILKTITLLLGQFGFDTMSKVWNSVVILISSLLAISSLILIDRTALIIFGAKVARVSNWIYVLCPYTIFYCLSGGLTIYVLTGVSLISYIIADSYIFNLDKNAKSFSLNKTFILLLFSLIYISSLRPTGCLFALIIITILPLHVYILSFKRLIKINSKEIFVIFFVFIITIKFDNGISIIFTFLLFFLCKFFLKFICHPTHHIS